MNTNSLGSINGYLTGFIIEDALKNHPSKLKAVYNSDHEIEILDSSRISAEFVQNILYNSSEWRYEGPYPHVKDGNRTLKERNLIVTTFHLKPGQTKCCFYGPDCLLDHIDRSAQYHNAPLRNKMSDQNSKAI